MLHVDSDAVECDLAETYHIYNYRELPLRRVALYASGLGNDSRIKLKLTNSTLTLDQTLMAAILDKLNILIWQRTKDGQKGRKMPKSILTQLQSKKDNDIKAYTTVDAFERARAEILLKIEKEQDNG